MDKQNQRYNLLDEIDTEKDDWNIRVRVTRMWEVLNIKTTPCGFTKLQKFY